MKSLVWAVLAGVGILTATEPANAQYFNRFNYGAQVYYPPGYGYGYYPGMNPYGYAGSPYWSPAFAMPYAPSYSYSNSFSIRMTPFGVNWSAYRYQWINGGYYSPLAYSYPGYGYPDPGYGYVNPAPAVAVVPYRGRITRGFVPTINPLGGEFAMPVSGAVTENGSFTAWGAYMPGTGTYLNPFSGVMVR